MKIASETPASATRTGVFPARAKIHNCLSNETSVARPARELPQSRRWLGEVSRFFFFNYTPVCAEAVLYFSIIGTMLFPEQL